MSNGRESFRRAALSLAVLRSSDRDWLLGQLPVEDRSALEAELVSLSAEKMDIQALVELETSLDGTDAAAWPRDAVTLIDAQSPQRISSLMADWPLTLREALSSAHPWRWLPTGDLKPRGNAVAAQNATPTALLSLVKLVARDLRARS